MEVRPYAMSWVQIEADTERYKLQYIVGTFKGKYDFGHMKLTRGSTFFFQNRALNQNSVLIYYKRAGLSWWLFV